MALRKKTLRRMLPTTRKVARLQGEIASVGRRLKSLLDDIGRLELESRALHARQNYYKEVQEHGTGDTEGRGPGQADILQD